MQKALALTGTYVVAGELAAAAGDHVAGFAAYEAVMRPGVELSRRFAEKTAKEMTVSSRRKIALRMLLVRVLPGTPWKSLIARKIREEIPGAAHAVPVKEHAEYETLRAV